MQDNTDVNTYLFPGSDRVMTMTDFHLANHVDLSSLRTIGTVPFDDTELVDNAQFSGSHPGEFVDEATGDKFIINWVGVPGVIKKWVFGQKKGGGAQISCERVNQLATT